MAKTFVKVSKELGKTVGGVAHTSYPLSIHFHYQNAGKMTKFKLRKKMSKINLRIISEPHAHLQSMMNTSVKFQKNQNKTVGVAHTRYIKTKSQKLCPSAFLRKGGDNKLAHKRSVI